MQNYVGVTDAAWNNPGQGQGTLAGADGQGRRRHLHRGRATPASARSTPSSRWTKDGRATQFVIGVDSNQNMVKPGFVLTSMVKRVDNAVYDIVNDVVDGTFQGGFHVFGLETTASATPSTNTTSTCISRDAIEPSKQPRQKIIDGEIKVTDAMAQ